MKGKNDLLALPLVPFQRCVIFYLLIAATALHEQKNDGVDCGRQQKGAEPQNAGGDSVFNVRHKLLEAQLLCQNPTRNGAGKTAPEYALFDREASIQPVGGNAAVRQAEYERGNECGGGLCPEYVRRAPISGRMERTRRRWTRIVREARKKPCPRSSCSSWDSRLSVS